MAKGKQDDETGIAPKASDGDLTPEAQLEHERDELAKRRKGGNGRPIDGQEPTSDEADGQLEAFPIGAVDGDPKVTHRNLIKAGMAVKLECALSRAAVPLTGGLHAFGAAGEVLVTFEAGKVQQVPEFGERQADGSRPVKAVKLVQELTAVHVRSGAGMYTLDQVLDILEREFGVPRTADKVAKVFGLTAERAAAG